jgi:hypothetical protein
MKAMAADTKALRSRYDTYSRWAERVASLIVIGLFVDIVSVWILRKPPLEAFLTIGADVLIVAGVWGEILLERRAREAGDGLVAEAEARAADATLEMERLKAQFSWRVISAAEMATLISALARSIGPINIMFVLDDAESHTYAMQFVVACRRAG